MSIWTPILPDVLFVCFRRDDGREKRIKAARIFETEKIIIIEILLAGKQPGDTNTRCEQRTLVEWTVAAVPNGQDEI